MALRGEGAGSKFITNDSIFQSPHHTNNSAFSYNFHFLSKSSVKRVMLPDTLGILTSKETADFVFEITSKYPKIHFDFQKKKSIVPDLR